MLRLPETEAALRAMLTFDRPADAALSAFFRGRPKLGRQDRSQIAEASYGVIRHLRTLEHLAQGRAPRRLLLAWLARHGGVNLRQFGDEVSPVELEWLRTVKAAELSDLPAAARQDVPDWLYDRLLEQYGTKTEALVSALNRSGPLDIRVNPLKISREAAQAALIRDGIAAEPTPWSPLGLRLKDKPALNRHTLFLDGAIEVQDEGSQLLALLTAPRRGEMVCDFCAGAGGKTLLLGGLMHNSGRLYAFDVAEKRLANLKPRLARSGLSNVHPQLISGETDPKLKRLAGKFDRVLVDAPCSGLGTLRRNPDLKWRQSPQSVAELIDKQKAILGSASRLVKAGGRLVYATCSLLREENEEGVEDFLISHGEFRRLPIGELLAARGIGLEMEEYLRLDPAIHGTDGFFAAVMEKLA
ncbi:MAG TPA: RsmB/NOP family class I SAM-dependent RNA methyltransferase [Thiobacillaceae bacterium]|nr:RsmB/NOP family class I SAM-dependent RNA methyltransferase [Thiobacillaceae bacterium]